MIVSALGSKTNGFCHVFQSIGFVTRCCLSNLQGDLIL